MKATPIRLRKVAAGLLACVGLATAYFLLCPRPDDSPGPAAPPALKGWIDLRVWEPGSTLRRGLNLRQASALPLKVGDRVRVDVEMNPPAYLYVLQIDTAGAVTPLYPWKPGQWEQRPVHEEPRARLHLPEEDTAAGEVGGWGVEPGPAGMETLVLLARATPLPSEVNLRALLGGIPAQKEWNHLLPAVWFENGSEVQVDPQGRDLETLKAKRIDDPVLHIQELLRERLREHGAYLLTVSYGYQGS